MNAIEDKIENLKTL